jgi:two-component system, NtrC family, sensor kinase
MHTLLADDDEMMRLLLAAVARSCGHEVTMARDGEEAWAIFQRETPPLVILDWQMPKLDGLEICQRIRSFVPSLDTFIVMVTARDTDRDLLRVLDAGADDYIFKPVSPEQFRARLTIAERRIGQQRDRRLTETALADARWLAGIGETTLAIQHEINNPLAALLGNLSLIETGVLSAEETKDAIAVIGVQARRIGAVVKRLQALRDPRSVEYVEGSRMLDLGGRDSQGR